MTQYKCFAVPMLSTSRTVSTEDADYWDMIGKGAEDGVSKFLAQKTAEGWHFVETTKLPVTNQNGGFLANQAVMIFRRDD